MRITSWNVNGLRAVMKKGLRGWLDSTRPDIVGLQEVRAAPEQLGDEIAQLNGWHTHIVAAEKPGYSGVALLSGRPPDEVHTSLEEPLFDSEGRVQIARWGKLVVTNVYVPNGNGKLRDNSRIPYKLAFSRHLFDKLEAFRRNGDRVIVMGDINTAPDEIDLARPKANSKTSGFTVPERAEVARWLRAGYVDTFRHFEPAGGHYSWWSSRFGVREKNIGWRIDLVLATKDTLPFLKRAFIEPHVTGSDHCPVGVELSDDVTH
jgi:exodeoxyribonuclease III